MKNVLGSACLMGERARSDGRDKRVESDVLARWMAEGRVVVACPEVDDGLPVPRPLAESQPDGRVVDARSRDGRGAGRDTDMTRSGRRLFAVAAIRLATRLPRSPRR